MMTCVVRGTLGRRLRRRRYAWSDDVEDTAINTARRWRKSRYENEMKARNLITK